jgi:outer membrane lipoprotein-sorting protein
MKAPLIYIAVLVLGATSADASSPASPAERIMGETVRRYSELKSYVASGWVTASDDRLYPVEFRMSFKQPVWFRLDMSRHAIQIERTIVWSDEGGFYTWFDDNAQVNSAPTLYQATAGWVSMVAVHLPTLMMRTEHTGERWILPELRSLHLAGIGEQDERRCFHLKGLSRGAATPYELWIDEENYLIRRIRYVMPGGTAIDETHRNIEINGDI